jgi:hypothetical protein
VVKNEEVMCIVDGVVIYGTRAVCVKEVESADIVL